KACVDGQCKEGVPGSGADRCTEDKNCADPPVHNECKDQACQEVSGSDVNRCTEGTDECVEGLCKGKPGTPGESCPDAGYNTCKPATVSAEGDCAKSKVNSWQAQITEGISKVSICGVDTEKLVKAIIASESSGIITKENNGHCGLMQLSPNDVRNYAPKCKLPSSPNLKSTDVTCDWLKKTENAAASICLGANYLQFFASTQCGNLRNIAAGFNGGSSALSESANCGSGSGKCQVCPGQSWNTKRWECLWEDNEHSICNASRTSGSYQETRKYVPKVWGCYNQF
ncbi:MAG: transglycosylase SLT domain-containing protein, partial [bacterium]|nr:transglycosylase SLT domain-containing protein [bacterium]